MSPPPDLVQPPDELWANIIHSVREPLLLLDATLHVVVANPSFCRLFHLEPDKIPGQSFYRLGNGQLNILPLKERLDALLQQNTPIDAFEVEYDVPLIGRRIMCLSAQPIHRPKPHAPMVLVSIEDVTVRKAAEQDKERAQRYAENIVNTVREPLLVLDSAFRVVSANRSFYDTFRVAPDETAKQSLYALGDHQWDIPAVHQLEQLLATHDEVEDVEVSHDFPTIGHKTMVVNARHVLDPLDGQPFILLAIEDITARRRAEESLLAEKERAQITLDCIGDAVITTDAEGVVQYLNAVAATLTGWTEDNAKGQPLSRVFHIVDENHSPAPDPVARCLEEEVVTGLANHTLLISREGQEFHIQDSAAPIRSRNGRVLGAVLVFRDVTEARRVGIRMAHQATHDALTGLVNREEFNLRLERMLGATKLQGVDDALCYLDLDEFKVINDTCGHTAGDELLRQIASLLRQHVRERDTVARLGGDEFGLLLAHCSLKQALRVAHVVRGAFERFQFQWNKETFRLGVSIGIVAVTDMGDGTSGVVSAADTACYLAKRNGGNRIHVDGGGDDLEGLSGPE